jgi:UDP-N-acetylglucosamine acyltransferase
MGKIHPTAVVEEGAALADTVQVGPFCHVGAQVKLGPGCRLHASVVIEGRTTIGEGCEIFPFASLGTQTQDLKYRGGPTSVMIGDNTTIREYVTINAATGPGEATVVGSGCHIMTAAHIAHNCLVGDRVIIANCGTLGGHVVVEDRAIIGGLSAAHQFVRIGSFAIVGGCSKVTQDIPPYMLADGHPAQVRTINRVGLERAGFPSNARAALRQAYKIIYRRGLSLQAAIETVQDEVPDCAEVDALVAFLRNSDRGVAR